MLDEKTETSQRLGCSVLMILEGFTASQAWRPAGRLVQKQFGGMVQPPVWQLQYTCFMDAHK